MNIPDSNQDTKQKKSSQTAKKKYIKFKKYIKLMDFY